MDKKYQLEIIKDFSLAKGVSGFEDEIVSLIKSKTSHLGTLKEDSMRNLYVNYKNNTGNKPLIQLDAHTDEVGFMVQSINPRGTLNFIQLGGWVPSSVPSHKVKVRNAKGNYITGIIASKPPHYMSDADRKAPLSLDAMTIDIGATSREDAINNFHVRIGEPVVPYSDFEYMENHDIMVGKAFDCRLGCAAMLATMEELSNETLDVDIVGAFATQEEVGTRGAIITSNTLRPDAAIVFEGCPADDTHGDISIAQTILKKGPMLRHVDARMITNPRYQRLALDIAEELSIPVQEGVRTGGATNGSAIHLAATGVPVIVIGLPVRYIHTHYGLASYNDYKAAIDLGCAVIRKLNKNVIENF